MANFTITHANGRVSRRSSKTKTYTHGVVAYKDGQADGVWTWSSSEALAEKAANTLRNRDKESSYTYRVVAVD